MPGTDVRDCGITDCSSVKAITRNRELVQGFKISMHSGMTTPAIKFATLVAVALAIATVGAASACNAPGSRTTELASARDGVDPPASDALTSRLPLKPHFPCMSPKASDADYLVDALDANTWSVGPCFKGHRVAAIVDVLERANPFKSEFETRKKFLIRFPPRHLIGTLTPDSYLAAPLTIDSTGGATFRYDAEKETFSVAVRTEDQQRGSGHYNWLFTQDADTIVFRQSEFSRATWNLAMPRPDARSFSDGARVVMVYKLAPPWLEPWLEWGNKDLYIRPEQLWVIDRVGGKVLQKLHIASGLLEGAPRIAPEARRSARGLAVKPSMRGLPVKPSM